MSGRKNTLPVISIVTNGDMSGNITSSSVGAEFLDQMSIQCNITGSPVGTFDVQVSDDNVNWVSVPLDPTPSTSPQPVRIQLTLESPKWIRLIYNSSSGSGTLNATIRGTQL